MSILSILLLLSACAASPQGEEPSAPTQQPATKTYTMTDKQANEEARHLFDVLASFYGKQIMSGVVAKVDWNIVEAENVYQWTGQYPALNVFDFNNMHASKDVNPNGWLDYSDISVVRQWHQNGGVVGCMWHWNMRANNGTDMTCSPGDQAWETKFDCSRLSDTNSQEYKQVCKDIDQVASYLKRMQKEGIPVIWRPLHEAAGNIYEYTGGKAWFWWGAQGAEAYKALWRFMYDRLVQHHGLHNLIWVWTSQVNDTAFYPGDDYVDIIGRDNYYALQYPLHKEYEQLSRLYPTKMITLAECGNGDEVKMSLMGNIWQEGSRWLWFMTWYDYDYTLDAGENHRYASRSWWLEAFTHPYVLTRDKMKQLLTP